MVIFGGYFWWAQTHHVFWPYTILIYLDVCIFRQYYIKGRINSKKQLFGVFGRYILFEQAWEHIRELQHTHEHKFHHHLNPPPIRATLDRLYVLVYLNIPTNTITDVWSLKLSHLEWDLIIFVYVRSVGSPVGKVGGNFRWRFRWRHLINWPSLIKIMLFWSIMVLNFLIHDKMNIKMFVL